MKKLFVAISILLCSLTANSQLVVDNASMYDNDEEAQLSDDLFDFWFKTDIQALIYTTKSLKGKTPVEFGLELSETYHPGKRGINNGIIILLSLSEKKVQILVGFGLEWILTDSITALIVNQITPSFKNDEFYNGTASCLTLIAQEVDYKDWVVYQTQHLSDSLNNKIIHFCYTNKTMAGLFKKTDREGVQFSNEYFINIPIEDTIYQLYYSKYMDALISTIVTSPQTEIYFRLSSFENKRLELLGVTNN